MLRDWRSEFNRFLTILGLASLIGLLMGKLLLAILIAVSSYLLYSVFQMYRLYRWLHQTEQEEQSEPPESSGLWGDLFDGIYRLQRRERQAVNHLESILDKAQESSAALAMAVIMINQKGNLEWWNKAANDLLGFREGQDHQQGVTNLLREPRFFEYFERKEYSEPLRIPSPVNKNLILEFQITLFGEGDRLMLVRDVTQMHKLELMRKDFVGNVSHELRTPITVINGYLENLLDHRESIAPRWGRALEQMHQQSQRMESIVRDLLTLSRLETKALSKEQETVDVASLLREIVREAEQVFENKSHDYSVNITQDVALRGNRSELYSALSNLVFNAAKYTAHEGKISVHVIERGNALDIVVEDNGPGIEEHHLPRLTERFYRIDESRSTDTGGTGLGLAIVKHVLARHGANLDINSEIDKGSRFICHFPPDRVIRTSR
ncbi:MAG: phosphate regulon sensor histidine kinase PhoR [Pseudohongiellaceae bacterium]|nr:phosphate regulon sensor histidine kinase PhoR [Pseudohongiellaceae bacterium]